MSRARERATRCARPMSIYEVHLGSWRLQPARRATARSPTASSPTSSAPTSTDMGFTHVELLPVMAHPFSGSWGYQVTVLLRARRRATARPTTSARSSTGCTRRGIGVILDWVPAHFPRDDWALARFDGTALYEHDDPRRGAHPDWGTLIFNFGRNEVRNFLLSNALYWLREYHADGLRVDAVASMLYLDYSRKEGEWVPNELRRPREPRRRQLPARAQRDRLRARARRSPWSPRSRRRGRASRGRRTSAASASASSGTWAGCTTRSSTSRKDPIHRRYHHHELTFSLDVRVQRELHPAAVARRGRARQGLAARPDARRPLAAASPTCARSTPTCGRTPARSSCSWAASSARSPSGATTRSLDWHLLEDPEHAGVQPLVARPQPPLPRAPARSGRRDASPEGFWWLEPNDAEHSVLAFCRADPDGDDVVVCVANLTPVPRDDYRVGLPRAGRWREVAQHRLDVLRRLGRRQLRRRRGRGGGLAPSAVLGRRSRCRRSACCPGSSPRPPCPDEPGDLARVAPSPSAPRGTAAGTNFSLFSEHAERVDALPLRRRGRGGAHPDAPSARRSTGTSTCPASAPASATGTACTARTLRPPGTASTATSCSSTRTRGRSTARCAWDVGSASSATCRPATSTPTSSPTTTDDAAAIPKCVVVDPAFDWEDDRLAAHPWSETVIYETHVRGFTMRNPEVREDLRGTYAGLASDAAIEYLTASRRDGRRAAADPPHRRRALPARRAA